MFRSMQTVAYLFCTGIIPIVPLIGVDIFKNGGGSHDLYAHIGHQMLELFYKTHPFIAYG